MEGGGGRSSTEMLPILLNSSVLFPMFFGCFSVASTMFYCCFIPNLSNVLFQSLNYLIHLDLTCIYLPSNFLVLVTNVLLAYLKASPTILVYSLALKSFNLDSISLVQHVDPCGQTSKWSPTI